MSTINIFGNTIEYQSGIYNEKYLVHKSLRWHITDVYGWDMNQSEIREMKLDEILESKKESSYLYNLSLRKKDEDGWGHYTITFNGKVLKLYSTSDGPLRIELKCDSLNRFKMFYNKQFNKTELSKEFGVPRATIYRWEKVLKERREL